MAKKDLRLNPPTTKTDLTKDNMLSFVKKYGTKEEKKWFYDVLKNPDNRIIKQIHFSGEGKTVNGYDISKIRKLFIAKFEEFNHLDNRTTRRRETQATTFEQEVEGLLD